METKKYKTYEEQMMQDIPMVNEPAAVYSYTSNFKISSEIIKFLNDLIGIGDVLLAKWLNITPRTLLNYKKSKDLVLKENLKEHIVLLLSLYKHGKEVFGSTSNFEYWLTQKNILLDNQAPSDFLSTISGINFIDNRLTALEYGDNA